MRTDDAEFDSEGGWRLYGRLYRPLSLQGAAPAVLLVPGHGQSSAAFRGWNLPVRGAEMAALGCVALALDPSGRGRSWGVDDAGGPAHQGDIRAALRRLILHPSVDPARVAVLSISAGALPVAAALAAPGDLPPLAGWIDWEGPSDREIVTAGGKRMDPALGRRLDDDAFWYPREPVRFVGRIKTPYLRYQSIRDHAQPGELRHALRMIRAAAAGDLPWFQLNENPRNEAPESPVWMPPGIGPAARWIQERLRDILKLP